MTSEISPDRLGAPSTDEVCIKLEMLADATAIRNTHEIDLMHDEDDVLKNTVRPPTTEAPGERMANVQSPERGHTISGPSSVIDNLHGHTSLAAPSVLHCDEGFNDLFPQEWNNSDEDNGLNFVDQSDNRTVEGTAASDASQAASPLDMTEALISKGQEQELQSSSGKSSPDNASTRSIIVKTPEGKEIEDHFQKRKSPMATLSASVRHAAISAMTRLDWARGKVFTLCMCTKEAAYVR